MQRPLFRALDALAIDDAGGWAGLALHRLSAFHVKRVVNVLQRAVVIPQIEIIEERALGWKVFGNIAPLTARAQYIHDPVDDLAHIDFSLSPAMFGRTNQRRDVRPLLVRQIARITQLVTIVFGAVLACPHRRPLLNQAANLESHPIHPIQLLSGRTLTPTSLTFVPKIRACQAMDLPYSNM